jgi:hypothetical protein
MPTEYRHGEAVAFLRLQVAKASNSKIQNFLETACEQILGYRRNWNPGMRLFFSSDRMKDRTADCMTVDSMTLTKLTDCLAACLQTTECMT